MAAQLHKNPVSREFILHTQVYVAFTEYCRLLSCLMIIPLWPITSWLCNRKAVTKLDKLYKPVAKQCEQGRGDPSLILKFGTQVRKLLISGCYWGCMKNNYMVKIGNCKPQYFNDENIKGSFNSIFYLEHRLGGYSE